MAILTWDKAKTRTTNIQGYTWHTGTQNLTHVNHVSALQAPLMGFNFV